MKAAEISAKRGHEVILYEKNDMLGGQLNLVKKIPFRNEFSEVVRYLDFQLKRLDNLDVRLNTEATADLIFADSPDVVIVATGASRSVPDEYKNDKTVSSREILEDRVKIKRNIIIYDQLAKAEGVGVADYLTEYYDDIKIQFFTPVAHEGEGIHFLNQDVVRRKLYKRDILFQPFYEILRADLDTITFLHRCSRKECLIDEYDNFIYIGEMYSNNSLYMELKGKVGERYTG
jgi:hypothetical protein